jgi:type IV pilus assembly protein PilE
MGDIMMQQRQSRGMTLVELMVVVVIVAILAGVAYPSYRQYAIRSNRTEAKTQLLQLAQTLEKCYTRSHSYDDCVPDEDFDTPSGNYSITVATDDQTYTLKAAPQGGQADDEKCGTLATNETGARKERETYDPDPANKCW